MECEPISYLGCVSPLLLMTIILKKSVIFSSLLFLVSWRNVGEREMFHYRDDMLESEEVGLAGRVVSREGASECVVAGAEAPWKSKQRS